MSAIDLYCLFAISYSAYCLGLMHGHGHRHWKNLLVAVMAGAIWPLFSLWGVFIVHYRDTQR